MYKREYIDLAILSNTFSKEQITDKVVGALNYKPRGVCMNPVVADYVAVDMAEDNNGIAKYFNKLYDEEILRQFVIDFPYGQGGAEAKDRQSHALIKVDVVDEFDVMANIGAILEGDYKTFAEEIQAVTQWGKPVKVIVESGCYTHDLKTLNRIVHWCAEVGAFAIKTSTGVVHNIPNIEKVKHAALWGSIIEGHGYTLKIKDSGGKRCREDIDDSLAVGADIIGASKLIP